MASIKRALPQRRLFKRTVAGVFDTLDWLEERLARQPYLVSDELTEADIRLFTTLVRFDPVYYGHFKCNRRALVDYPALWDYTRALYQHPDIRPTVNFDHIKGHYYGSHPWLNPSGIRAGPGCLNRISASISGASAGVRLPDGAAAG